jgi:hypothetical protein
MTTPADFTTRTRDDIYSIYRSFLDLKQRVTNMTDEVTALGGAAGIYGAAGVNFPTQGDGFTYTNMTDAFTALVSLVATPTTAQKNAIIKARRE